jgi:hypothetical protein
MVGVAVEGCLLGVPLAVCFGGSMGCEGVEGRMARGWAGCGSEDDCDCDCDCEARASSSAR